MFIVIVFVEEWWGRYKLKGRSFEFVSEDSFDELFASLVKLFNEAVEDLLDELLCCFSEHLFVVFVVLVSVFSELLEFLSVVVNGHFGFVGEVECEVLVYLFPFSFC